MPRPATSTTSLAHITEDMDNRSKMMQKRMQKLETARAGHRAAHALWPRRGAHRPGGLGLDLRRAARGGRPAGWARHAWCTFATCGPSRQRPPPEALHGGKLVVVENNYTGQFKRLLQSETCIQVDHTILRYDGRAFSPEGCPGRPEGGSIAWQSLRRTMQAPCKPTWCPGCGDFGILNAVKQGLVKAGLAPHEVLIVSGIGCGSKLPDYANVNGFMTLHGRPVPVATGAKLANHGLKVITVHGDGDCMGLGMGHFIHTARRNLDIVDMIQNNQIYGLTKGQYSPTSDPGFITSTSPDGAIEMAANPLALALAAGGDLYGPGLCRRHQGPGRP